MSSSPGTRYTELSTPLHPHGCTPSPPAPGVFPPHLPYPSQPLLLGYLTALQVRSPDPSPWTNTEVAPSSQTLQGRPCFLPLPASGGTHILGLLHPPRPSLPLTPNPASVFMPHMTSCLPASLVGLCGDAGPPGPSSPLVSRLTPNPVFRAPWPYNAAALGRGGLRAEGLTLRPPITLSPSGVAPSQLPRALSAHQALLPLRDRRQGACGSRPAQR